MTFSERVKALNKSATTGTLLLASVTFLSACSSGGAVSPPAVTTAAQTATSSASNPAPTTTASSPQADPSDMPSSTPDSPVETSSADETSLGSAPSPGPIDDKKAGVPLTLADFFSSSSGWDENRYDVADAKNVSGIAAVVRTFDKDRPEMLELRLANSFERLKFTVGQANDSESSEHILVVQVLGNGSQLDVKRIPFNTTETLTLAVSKVNAVQFRFYLDNESGARGGTATAVISGITVE